MQKRLAYAALLIAAAIVAVVLIRVGRAAPTDTALEQALVGREWETALRLAQAWLQREPDSIVAAWLVYRSAHRLPDDHASWPGRDRVTSPLHPDLAPMGVWARALTDRYPQSPVAWQLRADAATLADKPDEAMPAAAEAVRLAPEDPYSYLARAWAFVIGHDDASALSDVQSAVRIAPRCAPAYGDLGVLRRGRRQYDLSLQAFQTSVRTEPRYTTGHYFLGREYWFAGDRAKALAELERAVALGARSFRIYMQIGVLYRQQGKLPQALENLTKAVSCLPEAATPYLWRASVYIALRDPAHALTDLGHSVALQPRDADVQYSAHKLFGRLGKPNEATIAARAFLAVADPADGRAAAVRKALSTPGGKR